MINGTLMKWTIGGSISGIVALLSFMGYGIVGNEVRNIVDHKEIREEVIEKVDRLRDVVVDVRLEQMEQRGFLERIEAKL